MPTEHTTAIIAVLIIGTYKSVNQITRGHQNEIHFGVLFLSGEIIMKIRTPEYYKEFACVGGSCIDTCCAGWEVDVDKKSSAYYKSVPGDFGERLRSMLIDCPVEDRFILQEQGRCPFLNEANLCDIYTELGSDKLCETCTNFPRHITEFGNTREIGISLSCPVAVELIMKRQEPVRFVTEENDEKISGYNDIDPELYFNLAKARENAYRLCQDRTRPVCERAALCLDFARALQKKLRHPGKLSAVCEQYKEAEFQTERLWKMKSSAVKGSLKSGVQQRLLLSWLLFYSEDLEHIKPEWKPVLTKTAEYIKKGMPKREEFGILMKSREYEYEHLLVYYIYRYFLRAVFDGELYEKAELGCAAFLMQYLNGEACFEQNGDFTFHDQITLMRLYSKETEHSEENLAQMYKEFKNNKAFSHDNVIGLLLGRATD